MEMENNKKILYSLNKENFIENGYKINKLDKLLLGFSGESVC